MSRSSPLQGDFIAVSSALPSIGGRDKPIQREPVHVLDLPSPRPAPAGRGPGSLRPDRRLRRLRSEEHTSELQSPCNLVCRLLLEKKKSRPAPSCTDCFLGGPSSRTSRCQPPSGSRTSRPSRARLPS